MDEKINFGQNTKPEKDQLNPDTSPSAGTSPEHQETSDPFDNTVFNYLQGWVDESAGLYESADFQTVIDLIANFSDALEQVEQDIKTKQFQDIATTITALDESGNKILLLIPELKKPIDQLLEQVWDWNNKQSGDHSEFFISLTDRVNNDGAKGLWHPKEPPYPYYLHEKLNSIDWNDYDEETHDGDVNKVLSSLTEYKEFASNMSRFFYSVEAFYQNMKHLVEHRDEVLARPDKQVAYGNHAYRHSTFKQFIRDHERRDHADFQAELAEAKAKQEPWETKYNVLEEKGAINWAEI